MPDHYMDDIYSDINRKKQLEDAQKNKEFDRDIDAYNKGKENLTDEERVDRLKDAARKKRLYNDISGSINSFEEAKKDPNLVKELQGIGFETAVNVATDSLTTWLGWAPPAYAVVNFLSAGGANLVAQKKIRGKEDINWGEAWAAAGLGTIPFMNPAAGKLTKVVGKPQTIKRAVVGGGLTGVGYQQIEAGINERRVISPTEATLGFATGGVVSGGITGAIKGSQELAKNLLRNINSELVYADFADDVNRLQYKADIEHNDYVKLQLKDWGMEDGVFRIDKFFSKVRKDPITGIQQKTPTEGRKFIELFLTPKALMEDFNKLRSDPQGAHQVFKSRFVDMLEKRGLDPSLVNYHHIAGLYDALPLYEGLTYGSDEWWDLTALLLERNIRPGASGFKEKTNFMSILGMAQQQGQKGKDAMPHGVAHLFYKDELGPQRTFNKENDLFFSKSEIEAIQTPGNYRDPTTGEMHNSYREFKAKKWADVVNYSEDIAIEAMKQWEAVNPKGNMDFTELVTYLNTLDDAGKLSRIKGKYQVPLIPNIIEEITEAQKELEHLDPVSDTYKAALVNKLLDMNLPKEFINSYVKKISPGGRSISLEKLPEKVKDIKISNPRGKKKKYKK